MLFSSIPFLYYFLPSVLLLYAVAPKRCKNAVLLLASLIFYAWGEPVYVLLMTATVLLGYLLGLGIEAYRGRRAGKVLTALSVCLSLGALAYFKYADFFIASFNAATGLSVPLLRVALPIGISFYTFQLLSYTIDVHRGTVPAQRNFFRLFTYIAMFPQLIAGPIVRYTDVARELRDRTHTLEETALGVRRFLIGLGKKVILANTLGELTQLAAAAAEPSVLWQWMYAIGFSLQIYYDFSGYSDMAIGLGLLFGFHFNENFNYPFISSSVTEFWRRWHMSLGTWFRDYLYIPLGGNRVSRSRWLLNLLIVWMATGLWHGAAWNFVAWGLFFALALMLEKLWLGKYLKKLPFFAHVYTLLMVCVSFVLFNASSLRQAWQQIGAMFGMGGLPLLSGESLFFMKNYGLTLLFAMLGATPLLKCAAQRMQPRNLCRKGLYVVEPLLLMALLLVVTACLVNGSYNPFLYFRF